MKRRKCSTNLSNSFFWWAEVNELMEIHDAHTHKHTGLLSAFPPGARCGSDIKQLTFKHNAIGHLGHPSRSTPKKKTSKCEREEIEVSKASKTSENLESIFLAVFYILWAHENIRNPCAFEFAFRGFGDESGFLEAEHTHDNIVNQTEVTEKAEYTFQRIPMPLWDTAVRQREMYGSRWTDCQKSAWDIKGYT